MRILAEFFEEMCKLWIYNGHQCIFGRSVIQVNRVRLNVRHSYRNIRRQRFHGGNATAG